MLHGLIFIIGGSIGALVMALIAGGSRYDK